MHEIAETADTAPTPSGDPDGFTAFYRREYPGAVRLAWLLTSRSADSEDIVQEAFTRIAGRFRTLDTPAAYLRISVVNGCREAHRRRERERRRDERVPVLVSSEDVHAADDAHLLELVAALPYPQRAVLVLRHWADLPDAAIAEALGVRPANVRSMAFRAAHRLHKELNR